jgi:hypothetical protein
MLKKGLQRVPTFRLSRFLPRGIIGDKEQNYRIPSSLTRAGKKSPFLPAPTKAPRFLMLGKNALRKVMPSQGHPSKQHAFDSSAFALFKGA